MKSLNFTQGFYPRRLDTHTWDQEAFQEAILGWAKSQVPYTNYTVPTVVEGVNITVGANIQVSAGWVLWQVSGVLKLLRVAAATVSVSTEDSMSLQLQTAYGTASPLNGVTYPASVTTRDITVDTPAGLGYPYKDEFLLPVAGATPGGTFFVLDTLRYGGAAVGETKDFDLTAAEMTALGFNLSTGRGSGFYNGWQIQSAYAGRSFIGAGTLSGGETYTAKGTGGTERHLLLSAESGVAAHHHVDTISQSGDPSIVVSALVDGENTVVTTNSTPGELNLTNATYKHIKPTANAAQAHENRSPYYVVYKTKKVR
jgi:hypothetical protein